MSTTQPARYNPDLLSMDDEMEMATSPYRQADDIDIDLDPIHDSTNKSLPDEADLTNDNLDPMQADTEITYHDDDMIDDEELEDQTYNSVNQDLSMEAYDDNHAEDQDEDIIFDEEAEVTTIHYQPTDDHGTSNIAIPLDLDQNQDQNQDQGRVDQTDTIPEIQTEHEQDEDEQQANTNTRTNEEHEALEEETTILPESPRAQHEMTEGQIYSESEDIPRTYTTSTANNDKSGGLEEDTVSEHPEQHSNTNTVKHPNDTVEQEADEAQQPPALQSQEVLNTNDSNVTQVVESEQPDYLVVSEPQANDLDDNPAGDASSDLHSVVVTYLGQEMSLFPPSFGDTSATFLLADPVLAYDPFEKLLVACRSLLGESLEHDDELVLDIPTLGLHISEDSKYASELGLAQVLEVYLALSRNERTDTPEPLHCHLSSRVCLSSQYSYLATSAREGKCYSEIAVDYAESPEEDAETYDQEFEHQQKETEDPSIVEGAVYPGHEADRDSVDSIGLQEDPVVTDLHAVIAEETGTQSDLEDDIVNRAIGEDHTEELQTDGIETSSKDANELHNKSAEPSEIVPLNQHEPQPISDEQEDFASDDGDVEQVEDTVDDSVDEQHSEAQTPSSHTVEADYAGSEQDLDEEQWSQDQNQIDNDHAIVTMANGDHAQDDIEYSDEELFNDDPPEAINGPFHKENTPEIEEDLFAPQSNDHTFQDDTTTTSDMTDKNEINPIPMDQADHSISALESSNVSREKDDDFLDFEEGAASVPVTPSKATGNKRKVLDEDDELAFLDIETPEPKRRRPS